MEKSEWRWISLALEFIVGITKRKDGFYFLTTWEYRISRKAHFVKLLIIDRVFDAHDVFFDTIFKQNGLTIVLYQIVRANIVQSLGKC